MGQFNFHSLQIKVDPPLGTDGKLSVNFSPIPLMQMGFNIPITITTASIFRTGQSPEPLNAITLMANKIIKFDSKKSYSRINADYICVKNEVGKYIMLFIGKDNFYEDLCPVSFVVRNDDNYIYGQKFIGIKDIQIIDLKAKQQVAATKQE